MKVVTSVFVESAVASHQHYKDVLIEENMLSMQVYIDHLKDIFVQIDRNDSGEISMDELELFLTDASLQRYLESIDVHPDDAVTLFKLLDKDASGQINLEEFCSGCVRLRGEAKSFDIHCMIYENERMMHKFQEFQRYLDRGFLAKVDQSFEERLVDLTSRVTHGAHGQVDLMRNSMTKDSHRMSSQHSQHLSPDVKLLPPGGDTQGGDSSMPDVRLLPAGAIRRGNAPLKSPLPVNGVEIASSRLSTCLVVEPRDLRTKEVNV